LRISLSDRKLTADIAAKSLRKAAVGDPRGGPRGIALILQGCLVEGDVIAGLTAQPKAVKQAHAQDENVGSG